MLTVVGKLYGRVIKRVRAGTECAIGVEQCGFRQGRGRERPLEGAGPSVSVRQVCEKYLTNGKDIFWVIMNSEKAYDTINRHGMW